MTYKFWPHKEAQRIAKQWQNIDGPVVFETGYGPSGLPHIGTFAEVARTTYVMKAFQEQFPDRTMRLIVFSDDMDGLRSLPENIPNHGMLQGHMGKPLTSIPDPFGETKSFAHYMNQKLCQFLDHYGFDYEFMSSTRTYKNGVFDDGLKRVMDNYEAIHRLFTAEIAEDKRAAWSPFFPICSECGGIYTTRVTGFNAKNYTVSYACDQDGQGKFSPCQHSNEVPVTGGNVKVGWKVDWALRWFCLGIHYEMYGKDLLHSAKLSSQICRILGGRPPVTYKYELFLDESGAKISKKIGNGISMEQWQAYSPLPALLHFLLENPNKARRMGMPLLPKIVDDYLKTLRTQDKSNADKSLWFIDQLKHCPSTQNLAANDVSYALLVNVAENLGLHDNDLLYTYAARQGASVTDNEAFFRELCVKAIHYIKDYQAKHAAPVPEVDVQFMPFLPDFKAAVEQLVKDDAFTADNLQNAAFAVTREHDLNQREWFRFLYCALLKKEKGPRIGTFFHILGSDLVLEMIEQALERGL